MPGLCNQYRESVMHSVIHTVGINVCINYSPPKAITVLLANYPTNADAYVPVFLKLLEGMWQYSVSEFRKRSPSQAQQDKWEVCLLLLEVYYRLLTAAT
jgi:hypothetical protein